MGSKEGEKVEGRKGTRGVTPVNRNLFGVKEEGNATCDSQEVNMSKSENRKDCQKRPLCVDTAL